jgi:hypothetical protein
MRVISETRSQTTSIGAAMSMLAVHDRVRVSAMTGSSTRRPTGRIRLDAEVRTSDRLPLALQEPETLGGLHRSTPHDAETADSTAASRSRLHYLETSDIRGVDLGFSLGLMEGLAVRGDPGALRHPFSAGTVLTKSGAPQPKGRSTPPSPSTNPRTRLENTQ